MRGQYVFIGGVACDLLLSREAVPFRHTKDLDIVLILEALDEKFVEDFIEFVQEGEYTHINKGSGENQFYRFEKPKSRDYPYMIGLFSRRPGYLSAMDSRLAAIHVSDDVLSLSAIFLDEQYYSLLRRGAVTVENLTVLDLEYLILFKMKAWLDLSARKQWGEQVDSKNIKKHKNDVFRLAVNLQPNASVSLEGQVRNDVEAFVEAVSAERVDMESLGFKGISCEEVIENIKRCYGV